MAGGFHADDAIMDGIAARLRTASTDLEGSASPPPAPEAGSCTAAVAGVLALLTESIAGATEGAGAMGDAVATSRAQYADVDQAEADALGGAQR